MCLDFSFVTGQNPPILVKAKAIALLSAKHSSQTMFLQANSIT